MKVFVVLFLLVATLRLSAADLTADYSAWTKSWTNRPAASPALGGTGLKAVVSIIVGEKEISEIAKLTPVERLDLAYHIKVSVTEIATNGACRSYFVSNTSQKTGESQLLPSQKFQKLSEAMAQLPDDQSQLPPAGRRVVVQVWESGAWRIRVYDGNKLPPEVKSVLDLLANPYDKFL
jgi:hypothetical protein